MQLPQFPAGLVGPGTQPPEADGAAPDCRLPALGMATYAPPRLPDPEDLDALGPALALLERLQAALAAQAVAGTPIAFDLSGLDAANRTMLEETLGQGEVSALITDAAGAGRAPTRIQETRLAGLWWVLPGEDPGAGWLEVADLPAAVRADAFAGALDRVPLPDPLPAGLMNAPAVLIELKAQAAQRRPGATPHVVNLTLLPQTPADLDLLAATLGRGPVTLRSRGYGSCLVEATRLCHCWRVRYYNAEDRLILDTIEVTEAPIAILAAPEDLADSAERLAEILAALR